MRELKKEGLKTYWDFLEARDIFNDAAKIGTVRNHPDCICKDCIYDVFFCDAVDDDLEVFKDERNFYITKCKKYIKDDITVNIEQI